ncbi:YebC/PmpR family DNA-binding transcriptional regulator [Ureaplasma miroungigenitalium]|uniref:YebC/PmpR family DNA-binding transcriptional regulator n=1 Tax=Ureaplasma miroungigenitalium TaxID=1042321 RepID=UPI0021E7CBB9|nr:YebC/PmpR family DNA-binding transcriptional regulator [Ureaplasma miroungigenitalium]MCV3734079.1 YebC/PmpR family DNA-binding transcriptional regulator [Ureaplasma miroungigenitalium]
MPRKHLIASGINKKQQQQAKIWMKCAKEIKAATKVGGPNPEANPRLKAAINRALSNNLSRDSIQRNIEGANKDQENLVELHYEAFGPNGLAIMIHCLTDNENRTISAIRGYLSKLNASLAKPNSVAMSFNEYAIFLIAKKDATEDQIIETLLEVDLIDLALIDDIYEVKVSKEHFVQAKTLLDDAQLVYMNADIKWVPDDYIGLDDQQKEKLVRFINSCDDDDDVQWVATNFEEEI